MEVVQQALSDYGASLTHDGYIVSKSGKQLSVRVTIQRGRIRFEGSHGLLASGPIAERTVQKFVESFWFWKRQ